MAKKKAEHSREVRLSQGGHVLGLRDHLANQKNALLVDRATRDLLEYALGDPDGMWSVIDPNGFTPEHRTLIAEFYAAKPHESVQDKILRIASEYDVWRQKFTRSGFFDSLYLYCERKLADGTLPDDWVNPNLPQSPHHSNLIEAAKRHIRDLNYSGKPIKRRQPLLAAGVSFSALGPFIEGDVLWNRAYDKFLRHALKYPEILTPLNALAEKMVLQFRVGHLVDANKTMGELFELALRLSKDQPWAEEFNAEVRHVFDYIRKHPDRIEETNPATRKTLDGLKTFLNERFPVLDPATPEGRNAFIAACALMGWNWESIDTDKQQAMLAQNRKLHAAFERHATQASTRNALYDAAYREPNRAMAPREFSVFTAALALRMIYTLPELFVREVSSLYSFAHTKDFADNRDDEGGNEDATPPKKSHLTLFFEMAHSLREIVGPDVPLVDNLRKCEILYQLLRYQKHHPDAAGFTSLADFEKRLLNENHIVLSSSMHRAAGGEAEWDGLRNLTTTPEQDFDEMNALLSSVSPALVNYPFMSKEYQLQQLLKHDTYDTIIAEYLNTFARENSSSQGGSFLEGVLFTMQRYLGGQHSKYGKIMAELWPYVHVGVTDGVEQRHAAEGYNGLFNRLQKAGMDEDGTFAQLMTRAFETASGPGSFQNTHYAHFEEMVRLMQQEHARAGANDLLPLNPEAPLLGNNPEENRQALKLLGPIAGEAAPEWLRLDVPTMDLRLLPRHNVLSHGRSASKMVRDSVVNKGAAHMVARAQGKLTPEALYGNDVVVKSSGKGV